MKSIYKLTPVSDYDIQGTESWLQDMALRGLYLKKYRSLFCTFTPGPAKKTRYRIEPCRRAVDDDLPCAMLDLYEEYGWECVGDINREMLIFSTQDENAPELHTDPAIQGEQWKKLYKRARRDTVITPLFTLFFISCAGVLLFDQGIPITNFITSSLLLVVLLCICLLVNIPSAFLKKRDLELILRQLEDGTPLEHRAPYPKHNLSSPAYFTVVVLLWITLILSQCILPLTGGNLQALSDLQDFPLLSLSQVEGEDFVPYTMASDGYVDYANFARQEHYLLCWNSWEAVQTGEWDEDGSWNRMEVRWYDLPAPLAFLAKPMAKEQLDHSMALDEDIWWIAPEDEGGTWRITQYPGTGADYLAVAHREGTAFQTAAAALGDKVVLVQYTGHGDLSAHLTEIVNMIA